MSATKAIELIMESDYLLECNENDNLYLEAMNEFPKFDEFVLEARVDMKKDINKTLDNAVKNTTDTTKQTLQAYDDTTTGLGRVLKGVADVFLAMIRLISKCINFISSIFASQINQIVKIINFIMNIPADVRNLLRGNINLYITTEDLEFFHQTFFMNVKAYISQLKSLIEGKGWITKVFGDQSSMSNDVSAFGKLQKYYKRINIEFVKTNIDMSKSAFQEAYFSSDYKINIVDAQGKFVVVSYGEALKALMEKIHSFIPDLEDIKKRYNERLDKSDINSQLAKLSVSKQDKVRQIAVMTAMVVKSLMKILKYAQHDIGVINSANKRIQEKIKANKSK